jgi:hypothetical protein
MESGEEKKGFTIRDRRSSAKSEPGKEEPAKTEGAERPGRGEPEKTQEEEREPQLPEISFSSFILSLSTSALMHLGEVLDPINQKIEKNLPMAKQNIDMLGMLKDKTQGNLTPDEEKLLDHLLADLRWRYVRTSQP